MSAILGEKAFQPPGRWLVAEIPDVRIAVIYDSEMEIFAKSLPDTYGQDQMQFICAQSAGSLVEGITNPRIPDAKSVTFDRWPKSLKEIAIEMARLAE